MLKDNLASKRICGLWLAIVFAALIWNPNSAAAEAVYSGSDQTSTVQAPSGHPFVSGKHMVWIDGDAKGEQQVFYRNLVSGETKQLTDAASHKTVPVVSEGPGGRVYAAWIDRRTNGVDVGMWNIWGMAIDAGTDMQLSSQSGAISHVSIDGGDVVWFGTNNNIMYRYSLDQGKETQFGKGRSPVVSKGKALYINDQDGGLSLHDFATGETFPVLKLPRSEYVKNVTFNGLYGLFKQSDINWCTKMVLADLSNPRDPKFTDLTPQTQKESEYYQLYIGDGYAAWIQDRDGNSELTGVNTELKETYLIESGDAALNAYAFDGNRLVLKTADGNIAFRSFTRTVINANSGSGAPVSAPPAPVGDSKSSISKVLGHAGGELSVRDGQVKLTIGEGVFASDTTVELSLENRTSHPLGASSISNLSHASDVWAVKGITGEHPGKIKLDINYDDKTMTPLQQRKLSMYRWEDTTKTWIRITGHTDSSNKKVETYIPGSGIYTLVLNDISFRDVAGHWSQDVVEPLASRGIVDGMSDKAFEPDTGLTRAQFAKLLVASLGKHAAVQRSGTFADVQSTHWAAGWVEQAAKMGLVEGSDGKFDPDAPLTREQMIVMLARATGQEQKAQSLSESDIAAGLVYSDAGEISGWARSYAALATNDGLVQGSGGMLKPKRNSTRAEAAAVIYRLIERQNKL